MEKFAEGKLLAVKMTCDVCKLGDMVPDQRGQVMTTSSGPMYPHICTNCKKRAHFPTVYPTQILVLQENWRDLTKEEAEKLGMKKAPSPIVTK